MRLILATALCLSATLPAWAETRCGWVHNPTPGNWWLTDADGEWVLMYQGETSPPGMELIPDLTQGEWVRTNGDYGYGCACMKVMTNADRITGLTKFVQLPIARCTDDPDLPQRQP
jgi:hypothetical protein